MKKIIGIVVGLLVLVGCIFGFMQMNKGSSKPSGTDASYQAMIQTLPIDGKDYTMNISGKWQWVAYAGADESEGFLGMGVMLLGEDRTGQIGGLVSNISPVKAIEGRGGNKDVATVVSFNQMKGKRQIGTNKLHMRAYGSRGVTKNTIVVDKKGMVMKGRSVVHQKINDKDVPSKYYWVAYRVSDNGVS